MRWLYALHCGHCVAAASALPLLLYCCCAGTAATVPLPLLHAIHCTAAVLPLPLPLLLRWLACKHPSVAHCWPSLLPSLPCCCRGEIVEDVAPPLPLDMPLLLVKPPVGLSTPEIFKALDLGRRSTADPRDLLAGLASEGATQVKREAMGCGIGCGSHRSSWAAKQVFMLQAVHRLHALEV